MTLYRDKTYDERLEDRFQGCAHIEVQRCHHGRYDAHWGPHYIATPTGNEKQYREWCPGARLKDDNGS